MKPWNIQRKSSEYLSDFWMRKDSQRRKAKEETKNEKDLYFNVNRC